MKPYPTFDDKGFSIKEVNNVPSIRFHREINIFFLGKAVPATSGIPRNGRVHLIRKANVSCDNLAIVTQSGIANHNFGGLTSSRAILDPTTPRPTRKSIFTWNPFPNTLRITKLAGERRQAQWVGIKYKAHGLAQIDKQGAQVTVHNQEA